MFKYICRDCKNAFSSDKEFPLRCVACEEAAIRSRHRAEGKLEAVRLDGLRSSVFCPLIRDNCKIDCNFYIKSAVNLDQKTYARQGYCIYGLCPQCQ